MLDLKKILINILFICTSVNAIDCNVGCFEHLTLGSPKDKFNQVDQCLCKQNMAIGYSYTKKVPIWSSYYLTEKNLNDIDNSNIDYNEIRKKFCRFKSDTNIFDKKYRSYSSNYTNTGFERGHLSSGKSLTHTNLEEFMGISCLMSNIFPQNPTNNKSAWYELEEMERAFVEKKLHAFIINGIHFNNNLTNIKKKVGVPTHLYKIVFNLESKEKFAYYIPNTKIYKIDLDKYKLSIDEIEEKTGFDFFPLLPDEMEKTIEETI